MLRKLVIPMLVAIAAPVSALAADPIVLPIDSAGRGVPLADTVHDWSGFYAGVYGVAQGDDANRTQGGLGIALGANAQIDFVLVGAEVNLQGLAGDTVDTAYGSVLGRTGLVISDDILLYAATGLGWDLARGETDLLAGGGVEFALNDQLSLNAQYLRGFDPSGSEASDQFSLGARFQF
jgi:outer membrane immunogenic protein